MKLGTKLAAILGSTAIVSAVIITTLQVVVALPASEINKIAEQITVLIDGQNPGTGVIVEKKGNTYYVLTAKHVVETEDEYTLQTPDGNRYLLKYSTVKKLPNVDLAVVQFTSNKSYSIAKLADSDQIGIGFNVYIAGFPNPGREITQRLYQFTSSEISGRPKTPLRDGYALIYTNVTRAGMSGGPVLDANGRVVGIHGRAEAEGDPMTRNSVNQSGTEVNSKVGFNLGIPINTFRSLAPKVGVNLASSTEKSPQASTATTSPPANTSPSAGAIPRRPTRIIPTDVPEAPVCAGNRC